MDKWAGSFNDGTEASHQEFLQRRKKLQGVQNA
jgi:hypothetical protein